MNVRLISKIEVSELSLFRFIGCVTAGFPSPAADYTEDEIDLKTYLMPHPVSTFIMKVEGDSMMGANILPGCYLVIDRSIKPRNNSIVIAVVNGEITCKRLVKEGTTLALHSENPKYKPIYITPELDFIIWGTVTRILLDATTL